MATLKELYPAMEQGRKLKRESYDKDGFYVIARDMKANELKIVEDATDENGNVVLATLSIEELIEDDWMLY